MKVEHRTTKPIDQGSPFPLGVTLLPDGANFAIYSRNASEVFLLLFDRPATPAFQAEWTSLTQKEIRIDPADHYIANPRSTVVLLAH